MSLTLEKRTARNTVVELFSAASDYFCVITFANGKQESYQLSKKKTKENMARSIFWFIMSDLLEYGKVGKTATKEMKPFLAG